ncbi:MAG: 2-succinyl-5-enolpyruvyl-6-hydroxy-3-cyclohexene-1-carboxylic-acid synthase [Balneolaceae bacterium]|nr:2-succinyl-5-enolpyruvyl-6-hydroxy-3-cyclohexene-1-carboxylic-acid synthase [Balneolaceae bacterium]MBO6547116.1 2-succinyl-5-enolpyruvyl-6-hydroxy-3-cyclohexene-1-carboxylic-acid synthase [Balneolaceae bacterium]MBO6647937.1 2-succinyl-5-enolpyruvyl-6-hydroxy-3-cyclohexene-1-carboxylic-acid synthase [Balneolaceae bacterium]
MPERDPQNLNFYWSTQFVRALYEQGVRHAVISPGSRSTPLTLAFAAHPGFEKHIIIDERSAAFTALGIGKGSGIPACLVCTSGTAVANYYPAVIEATQSGVPVIITSADRPPHQRNIGASQTIDQLKIFGDYPVFFHETGEAKESNKSVLRLERVAQQATQIAIERGGVAHINFPFSKPFEPTKEFLAKIEDENEKHAKQTFHQFKTTIASTEISEQFWSELVSSEKSVLVVGPGASSEHLDTVSNLAKTLNAPVLAEPGSNMPSSKYTISGFDGFLRCDEVKERFKPDLILRFGEEPVSKGLSTYISENTECTQIRFLHGSLLDDESLSATKSINLSGVLHIPEIAGSVSKSWLKDWRKLQKDFISFRDDQLHPSSPLTDGYIFHTLSPLIPKKSFTMLSNSFPVRDLSLFGNFDGKEIYVNRGAAGIDGITSTAIGLSKSLKKAGVLFIGDIAFLHDSNALLNAFDLPESLLIVILNNGGGTIFRMLPINKFGKKYQEYFETPQSTSIAALCRAHKIGHDLISRPEQLVTLFEKKLEKSGVHILECITDADDSMAQRQVLWNYEPKHT